jgi:hypothetical protein
MRCSLPGTPNERREQRCRKPRELRPQGVPIGFCAEGIRQKAASFLGKLGETKILAQLEVLLVVLMLHRCLIEREGDATFGLLQILL